MELRIYILLYTKGEKSDSKVEIGNLKTEGGLKRETGKGIYPPCRRQENYIHLLSKGTKTGSRREEILNSRWFGEEMVHKKVTNWTTTTEMRNQRELAYKIRYKSDSQIKENDKGSRKTVDTHCNKSRQIS